MTEFLTAMARPTDDLLVRLRATCAALDARLVGHAAFRALRQLEAREALGERFEAVDGERLRASLHAELRDVSGFPALIALERAIRVLEGRAIGAQSAARAEEHAPELAGAGLNGAVAHVIGPDDGGTGHSNGAIALASEDFAGQPNFDNEADADDDDFVDDAGVDDAGVDDTSVDGEFSLSAFLSEIREETANRPDRDENSAGHDGADVIASSDAARPGAHSLIGVLSDAGDPDEVIDKADNNNEPAGAEGARDADHVAVELREPAPEVGFPLAHDENIAPALLAGTAKAVAAIPAPPPVPDDLTRIAGIDAGLRDRLAALGVVRFEQIATWTAGDVDRIAIALGATGVIQRQGWIEQAALLAHGVTTQFMRRGPVSLVPRPADEIPREIDGLASVGDALTAPTDVPRNGAALMSLADYAAAEREVRGADVKSLILPSAEENTAEDLTRARDDRPVKLSETPDGAAIAEDRVAEVRDGNTDTQSSVRPALFVRPQPVQIAREAAVPESVARLVASAFSQRVIADVKPAPAKVDTEVEEVEAEVLADTQPAPPATDPPEAGVSPDSLPVAVAVELKPDVDIPVVPAAERKPEAAHVPRSVMQVVNVALQVDRDQSQLDDGAPTEVMGEAPAGEHSAVAAFTSTQGPPDVRASIGEDTSAAIEIADDFVDGIPDLGAHAEVKIRASDDVQPDAVAETSEVESNGAGASHLGTTSASTAALQRVSAPSDSSDHPQSDASRAALSDEAYRAIVRGEVGEASVTIVRHDDAAPNASGGRGPRRRAGQSGAVKHPVVVHPHPPRTGLVRRFVRALKGSEEA